MQASKIIDTKRSFIPVEPNAFPENYLTTQKEDSPEESPKVVPYMGYNFLPTSYGYKSFFGINQQLNIDALGAEAEHIFLFQNLAYQNTLVALTQTGIWAKLATTTGAWTQIVGLVAPAEGIFYEWFYTIIKNKLYAFRANGNNFYEIATDIADPLGIEVNTKTPNFITPNAQLGMFRLGWRLGFWDATNAIGWSAPDDLTDFTPSALTGANVTTFNAVMGKISQIRPHGKNAIIYASKSIVHLQVEPSETFMVKATPMIDAGVAYARQSVSAADTTMHFCYSTTGIYKIENGKAEVIVPEIFDYFKPYSEQPIYLRLLNGRYLAFEVLDPEAVNGKPHFYNVNFPAGSVTFPGSTSMEGYHNLPMDKVNLCDAFNQVTNGDFDEMQANFAPLVPPDAATGAKGEPVWVCHLSNKGIKDLSNLTWDASPCGASAYDGEAWLMSPNADGTLLSSMTTDASNKETKTGSESWLDGKWTMQRFVQVQTAIWEMEQKVLDELHAAIAGRAFYKTRTLNDINDCAVIAPSETLCELGEFVSQFSPPKFGWNSCSFWLTRYCLETKTYKTHSKTTRQCITPDPTPLPPVGYVFANSGVPGTDVYGSAEAAFASMGLPEGSHLTAANGGITATGGTTAYATTHLIWNTALNPDGHMENTVIQAKYVASANKHIHAQVTSPTDGSAPQVTEQYNSGYVDQTDTSYANNQLDETKSGVLGVETAYCEMTGWKYKKKDGTVGFIPLESCSDTSNKAPSAGTFAYPGKGTNINDIQPSVIDQNGMMCNLPFVPPTDPSGIVWGDQTYTIPGNPFLFQDGSIAPRWPTIYGAFVYDLHLKKWGKLKHEYKQLLDYLPINSDSTEAVSGGNQGMLAGLLKENGFIYLFDKYPTDSEITWGKIGYYRQGMTDLQEVTVNFAAGATGKIKIDMSLDGKTIINDGHFEEEHTNVVQKTVYPPYSGKWFNLSVSGIYDISDITVKGLVKGRR